MGMLYTVPKPSYYVYRQFEGILIHVGLVKANSSDDALKIAKRDFPYIAPVVERKI